MALEHGDDPEPQEEDDDVSVNGDEEFARQYNPDNSWEALQEDEFGRLRPLDSTAEQRARRKRLLTAAQRARIRKGMIRYLQLVIDLSRAASVQDWRPNRLVVMLGLCRSFIREYFDQNPLSQMGLVIMRNGVAERLTEISGTPEAQIKRLEESLTASGDASLQNALELASSSLSSIPAYGHREILILFAGLSSCDPGNIFDAIKNCKDHRIRVSVVGLSAEVYVCRRCADDTGGSYNVALSETHLEELLMAHAPPPPTSAQHSGAELVRMGFPQRSTDAASAAVYVGPDCVLQSGSYTCPRCKARVMELPCECHVCGLMLISSPHLARSYHHLFPVKLYDEVLLDNVRNANMEVQDILWKESPHLLTCFGCLKDLVVASEQGGILLRCSLCKYLFCFECDTYVHESLHNCPGCECHKAASEYEGMG